jgi:hypothetical protein
MQQFERPSGLHVSLRQQYPTVVKSIWNHGHGVS